MSLCCTILQIKIVHLTGYVSCKTQMDFFQTCGNLCVQHSIKLISTAKKLALSALYSLCIQYEAKLKTFSRKFSFYYCSYSRVHQLFLFKCTRRRTFSVQCLPFTVTAGIGSDEYENSLYLLLHCVSREYSLDLPLCPAVFQREKNASGVFTITFSKLLEEQNALR